MEIYREVSDWKTRCSKLLEALQRIQALGSKQASAGVIARKAIEDFRDQL